MDIFDPSIALHLNAGTILPEAIVTVTLLLILAIDLDTPDTEPSQSSVLRSISPTAS